MAITETDNELRSLDGSVAVSKETARVTFSNVGKLAVAIVADDCGGVSQASIYGDPAGLIALADLLIAFAKLDQEGVSDRNCPCGEGVHATLTSGRGLVSKSVNLNLGRLDAKRTGESEWFLNHPPVTIINQSDSEIA